MNLPIAVQIPGIAPNSDGMVTLFDLSTGLPEKCHRVDAKERLARGGWSSFQPVNTEEMAGQLQGDDGQPEAVPIGDLEADLAAGGEPIKAKPLAEMTVRELRAFAKGKIVIPADAVSKEAILAVIEAALAGEPGAAQE